MRDQPLLFPLNDRRLAQAHEELEDKRIELATLSLERKRQTQAFNHQAKKLRRQITSLEDMLESMSAQAQHTTRGVEKGTEG